jgi:integrase
MNGKHERVERTASSKGEAVRLRRDLLNQRDNQLLATGPKQTFKEYSQHYLEYEAPSRCKETTINDYDLKLRVYIYPVFGDRPFRDITSSELQEFFIKLHKKYATKTVESIRGIMSGIFSAAERHGHIPSNPIKRTRPPQKKQFERPKRHTVWTEEELREVIAVSTDTPFQAFIYLASTTGLRLGELLGLTWEDLDFETGALYVQRTLRLTQDRLTRSNKKYQLVFNTPKTADSYRMLQVQPVVLDALTLHKMSQDLLRIEIGAEWADFDLVFPEKTGRPVNPTTFRGRYQKFLKSNGLRYIAPHDIRHTFATTLVANNASLQEVQQAMGHHDIKVTKNIYARDIPSLGHQAVSKMTQIAFPGSRENLALGITKPKKPFPSVPHQRRSQNAG